MTEKLVIETMLLMGVIIVESFVMAHSVTLFLTCRWSRKKSIAIFVALNLPHLLFLTFLKSPLVRMFGGSVLTIVLLGIIVKDVFVKRILVFMMYYMTLVFVESIISPIAYLLLPGSGVEKILQLSVYRCMFIFLCMTMTVTLMHFFCYFFKWKRLDISGKEFRPFFLLGVLQLALSIFITYFINSSIREAYVYLILLPIQTVMLGILLWLLWQLSVTGERSKLERELENCRWRARLDAKRYSEIRERMLENGKFRHDFYNHAQIVNCLLEQGTPESIQRAGNLINGLICQLEELQPDR